MKKFTFFYFLMTSMIFACFRDRITFDKENDISKYGEPNKIEYFKHIENQAFAYDTIPVFTILNKAEIEGVLSEIKSADDPELWKGAGWDRIVLTFNDTIIKINTNKQKIGLGASGSFFDLNENNFISKRLRGK